MGRANQQDGATAVEYGILAGVLGVVFIAAGPMLLESMLSLLDAVLDGMLG